MGPEAASKQAGRVSGDVPAEDAQFPRLLDVVDHFDVAGWLQKEQRCAAREGFDVKNGEMRSARRRLPPSQGTMGCAMLSPSVRLLVGRLARPHVWLGALLIHVSAVERAGLLTQLGAPNLR